MCGRLANKADAAARHNAIEWQPFLADYWSDAWESYRSYDVRPTNKVPILMATGQSSSAMTVQAVRWGWTPSWMKGPLINARWETAGDKKTFQRAVRERRCVIPAVAYYEWRRDVKDKPQAKYAFKGPPHETLLIAGLWTMETQDDGSEDPRFLVLTRDMQLYRHIHDRTPVMLTPTAAACWLDPKANESDIYDAAQVLSDHYLSVDEVTFEKAAQRIDGPHLLQPLQ